MMLKNPLERELVSIFKPHVTNTSKNPHEEWKQYVDHKKKTSELDQDQFSAMAFPHFPCGLRWINPTEIQLANSARTSLGKYRGAQLT